MTYGAIYINVLQKNFMLAIIAIALLVFTFFIWAGIPFFLVGSFVESITASRALTYFSIALSGGIIFSLYFLPINLRVARSMANIKESSVLSSFLKLEMVWVAVVAGMWGLGLVMLLFTEGF